MRLDHSIFRAYSLKLVNVSTEGCNVIRFVLFVDYRAVVRLHRHIIEIISLCFSTFFICIFSAFMIMSPAAVEENLEMLHTLSVFYNSCVTVLWIVNVSLSVRNFVISGHNNNDATDIYELYIGVMSSSVLEVALIRLKPHKL